MLVLGSPANGVTDSLEENLSIRLIPHGMSEGDDEMKMPCSSFLTLPTSDVGQDAEIDQG